MYPSITQDESVYSDINTIIQNKTLKINKMTKYITDIIINPIEDDDKYPLSFLISNDNTLGIFSTYIENIFLDINNLKDMTLDFIKTLYKNIYIRFYNKFYNNIKYKNKEDFILNLILKKEYNVPNDLYYINNFFFYRSFPIFNYLLCKNKKNIINNDDNIKFDYDAVTDIKLLKNVLFDLMYTNDDINIYKKNIINLLNSNNNIFEYIIFEERDDAIQQDLDNLNINDLRKINNMPSANTCNILILYILHYIFDKEFDLDVVLSIFIKDDSSLSSSSSDYPQHRVHQRNDKIIDFFNNNIVNDFLNKLINGKKYDIFYYLLYISRIVFYFNFFNYIYNHILQYSRRKEKDIDEMNEYLFIKDEIKLKEHYKHYFNESTFGYYYCSNNGLQILSNIPSKIKRFYNTLKFIDNIKNSQQSKLLIFLSFSNIQTKFLINDDKINILLSELLNLHDFKNYAIIYPQKKL